VQQVSTVSAAFLPRGTLAIGPFSGLTLAISAGEGVRSIDPIYISQDVRTPFASATSYDGGIQYFRHFDALDLSARSGAFLTRVDRDLIFSESEGRNVLGGPSQRVGNTTALRTTGRIFDIAANFTYVQATFQDTGFLIPYIPDIVVRFDGALFGDIPHLRLWNSSFHGVLGLGISYVAPRPLPQSQRGDAQFVVDLNASLHWKFFELGVTCTNLFDSRYRLGEYNYVSDFHSGAEPTLVPVRHFTAGAPRTVLVSLSITLGGAP